MDLSCDEDMLILGQYDLVNDNATLMYDDTDDLIASLVAREMENKPDPEYIKTTQCDGMDESWRSRIANWMVDVSTEFRFTHETIELALNYLDRYLTHTSVTKHQLQLIGLVALLIASKFHETDAMLLAEATELARTAGFSAAVICEMERKMLKVLKWQLRTVLPVHFLDCFIADMQHDMPGLRSICQPLLNVNLQTMATMSCRPSEVAAAIVTLGCQLSGYSVSVFSTYLANLSLSTDPVRILHCQRILLRCYNQTLAPLPLKRERAPSPASVDDLEPCEFTDLPPLEALCPQAKRPKLVE